MPRNEGLDISEGGVVLLYASESKFEKPIVFARVRRYSPPNMGPSGCSRTVLRFQQCIVSWRIDMRLHCRNEIDGAHLLENEPMRGSSNAAGCTELVHVLYMSILCQQFSLSRHPFTSHNGEFLRLKLLFRMQYLTIR